MDCLTAWLGPGNRQHFNVLALPGFRNWFLPMTDPARQHQPAHAEALEDARQHVVRALAALKAAAALDAVTAQRLAATHSALINVLADLERGQCP